MPFNVPPPPYESGVWTNMLSDVRADVYRYEGGSSLRHFWHAWRTEPGLRIICWLRLTACLRSYRWTRWGFYHVAAYIHHKLAVKYGVYIDPLTEIGGGLHLAHPCCIIINRRVRLGRNCNLAHSVTLGSTNRGERSGNPVLADRVFVGAGAVVIGAIKIGSDAAIGANAVVTKDVPSGAVVAGVPAQIISMGGSACYVNNVATE